MAGGPQRESEKDQPKPNEEPKEGPNPGDPPKKQEGGDE